MTRPQRQALFTLAMLALTVAPTVYVAATAWRINRPGHRLDVQAEIGRQLGLDVTLAEVRYPRPGEVDYRGAVLWQEEARGKGKKVKVAEADRLHLVREGRMLILRAEGLKLHGEGPSQAMDQVNALLGRAGRDAWDRISVSADRCAIVLGDPSAPGSLRFDLRDLAGSFFLDPSGPRVEASYRVVTPDGAANRCELTLTRDRGGEHVETTLTFNTAEGLPLPASPTLDPFFDSRSWLGPRARVQGSLTLEKSGGSDWGAEFSGSLSEVDLAALVDHRRVPDHRLTGTARLEIRSARWGPKPGGQGSGWIRAEGEMVAGPGRISASLLRALQSQMRFRLDGDLDLRPDDLEYQSFGLAFAMTPDGEIGLSGALGTAFDPGVVLVEPDGLDSMAFAPEGASNLLGLRRTLEPDADPELIAPMTPELQFLDYLPIPTGPRGGSAVGN